MKTNKEALILTALIAAITPFIIVYKIVKGIYDCCPHKIAERKKINEEIRTLEKELGRSESPKDNCVFDEYYYPYSHNNNRREYLKVLRKKKEENYTMPDIIIAAERAYGSICCPIFNESSEFNVLLLVNSNIYDCQEEENLFFGSNAKTYLEGRKNFVRSVSNLYWYFYTLQECPDYSKYYVVNTGLNIRFNKILDSEEVKKYIEEFRKNNPKKER